MPVRNASPSVRLGYADGRLVTGEDGAVAAVALPSRSPQQPRADANTGPTTGRSPTRLVDDRCPGQPSGPRDLAGQYLMDRIQRTPNRSRRITRTRHSLNPCPEAPRGFQEAAAPRPAAGASSSYVAVSSDGSRPPWASGALPRQPDGCLTSSPQPRPRPHTRCGGPASTPDGGDSARLASSAGRGRAMRLQGRRRQLVQLLFLRRVLPPRPRSGTPASLSTL